MMGVADSTMWVERLFFRKAAGQSKDSMPAVPLAIQEWLEARVQIAMEEAKAAALHAREQQEKNLAIAIEEVAARSSAQAAASLNSIRENNELRVQLGTHQAMAHAEQGVAALALALKGVAKALASLKRDVETSMTALNQATEVAAASTQETERAVRSVEADLIAIQAALESKIAGHDAQIAAVAAGAQSAASDHAGLGGQIAEQTVQLASVAAKIESTVADYNAQLRAVEKRLEFVRQETMYELQASIMRMAGRRPDENGQSIARIVNPEKVERMRKSGLRLNIGCGHIQHDDFVNVDSRQLPGVDVIAEATNIPFAPEELQEISSSHLVEHFTSHILDRVLLPYWKSLLKPGGQLTTVAPDGAAMLAAVNNGTMTYEDFREVLFGAQDYDGDFHYNLITPDSFRDALARAGFVDIEAVYAEKRNGKCFEFKTIARKP